MVWEINFLEWLSNANQNPSLNWLSWVLNIITFSCDAGLIWIITAIIFLIFKKTRRCGIVLAVGLLIFALLINNILIKHLVHRIRPIYKSELLLDAVSHWMLPNGKGLFGLFEVPKVTSYSFMSGHSFSSFLCATIITFFFRKYGWTSFVFATIIAFSRLYFGVHYPTDVFAGMMLGAISGLVCIFFYRIINRKIENKKQVKAMNN